MAWAPEIPLTPSMKLKAFTKPISHTAVTRVSAASRAAAQMQRRDEEGGDTGAADALQDQAADGGQAAQIIDEAQGPEEADRRAERHGRGSANQGHGHQQPDHDRETAAARRRDGVRRPGARHVYGGQPAQQGDGQRLRGQDDNAAAHDGPRDLVPPTEWMLPAE